jgi:hypothetical protein
MRRILPLTLGGNTTKLENMANQQTTAAPYSPLGYSKAACIQQISITAA